MIAPDLPSPAELQPALEKLEAHPGSVILIAILQPEAVCNYATTTWAWLSSEERKAIKAALTRCREKRERTTPTHPYEHNL